MISQRIHLAIIGQLRRPKTRIPTLPKLPWDHGADGPANQENMVSEPATDIDPETGRETKNPNKVTRRRRLSPLEALEAQGKLTKEQGVVARELRDAAEGARNADPLAAIGKRIDRTTARPEPLADVFDARRKFHRMWALVPVPSRHVIEWVVLEGNYIRSMQSVLNGRMADVQLRRLRDGLDALRDKWGNSR